MRKFKAYYDSRSKKSAVIYEDTEDFDDTFYHYSDASDLNTAREIARALNRVEEPHL